MRAGVIEIAQFTSVASTAVITNLSLGFIPDFVVMVQDYKGNNPSLRFWANVTEFAGWDAGLTLLLTGSSGIVTPDASGITAYAGGDTANGSTTYKDRDGTAIASGLKTAPGITIPVDNQTESGKNLILAFRRLG